MAMLQAVPVLAIILATVLPLVTACPVHHVVKPVPFKAASVRPCVEAFATNLVTNPLPNVLAPISPLIHAEAVLLPVSEVPCVLAPVRPSFNSMSVLQVISPFAFVASRVRVDEGPLAVSLVVSPLSFVHVSILVKKLPVSVSFVVAPLTLVSCSVRPLHDTPAVSEAPSPLACVDRSSLELVSFLLHSVKRRSFLAESLQAFLLSEVDLVSPFQATKMAVKLATLVASPTRLDYPGSVIMRTHIALHRIRFGEDFSSFLLHCLRHHFDLLATSTARTARLPHFY
mmetsp:Transcript_18481/g.33294  ORF Transcript_18481/g.33294 Transcript_18481/m.33294 type:complete len:285 (-) Transcript_18481:3035-3889(-)